MKSRHIPTLVLALFAMACAGDTGQEDADMAAESTTPETMSTEMTADEAAIDQFRMDYVEHYNMHHPEVVAQMYDDSAVVLAADGGIHEGTDAILAELQSAMEGSPTLELTGRETMVFGDMAMAIGNYSVQATPPGAQPTTTTGNYMTGFRREDDGWKIVGVITNFDAPPPEGFAMTEMDSEEPPENGTMTDLVNAYETHFNLGHASMVADLYTDDAIVAFSNIPRGEGRAAVESALQERFAMGESPQIDIHDVYTEELGDGWAIDAGWYAITVGGQDAQDGTYMNLLRQQPDGSWKIHWMVSNGVPKTM